MMMTGLMVLAGCRRKDDPEGGVTPGPEPEPDAFLEIKPSEISCGEEGGTYSIDIRCSGQWDVQDTLSWVEVQKNGATKASVTVLKNDAGARNGAICFRGSGLESELVISQEASRRFSISTESISAGYDGGEFAVNVFSHLPWKVSCTEDWMETDILSGSDSKTVRIRVKASSEREVRKGKVLYIREKDTLQATVIQAACPFIDLAMTEFETDGDGGTFDLFYLSNTEVVAESQADWIRIIPLTSGSRVSFEVSRNPSEARTGSIIVCSATDSRFYGILTVRQGEKIPHPAMSFQEGREITVTTLEPLSLHPVFEDMTDMALNWKSSDSSVATVDHLGNVTPVRTGECTIEAYNAFHNLKAAITLKVKIKAESMTVMFGNQNVTQTPISYRFVGESLKVVVILEPEESYAEDFIYFSSDPEVASFSYNTLNCLKPGKTRIYVESAFNELRYDFTVFIDAAE